jgi:hypothetical protein
MKRHHLAFMTAVAGIWFATATAPVYAEPRAVLELFTSQGCSSCPAADKLLGELASDSSLIAISVPIDYWDYLGWKDTLAKPGHSTRQRAYAHARGDRRVYTPQMIVNGTVHALGSDKSAIEHAIAATQSKNGVMSVPVKISIAAGMLVVSVSSGKNGRGAADVWLCPVTRAVPVKIARGENRGRTVIYHNVVRRWIRLGVWTGQAESWSVPVAEFKTPGVDEAAVLVQSGATDMPGVIYGAAIASVR